jgi:hypothetical protein
MAGVTIAGDNEVGTELVPPGPGDCVVQPATDTAAMQMTRSAITFGSIQKPSLLDLINKTLTAKNFAHTATYPV